MQGHELILTIEGLPEEQGYVRASDFLWGLQSFVGTMNAADRLETGARSPSFYLRIIGLSMGSPATVVFEAKPKKDIDVREGVSTRLLAVIDRIQSQQEIALDDYGLLENLQHLVSPIGKSVASIQVSAEGETVRFTEMFRASVDLMMAAEETFRGKLTGMLEYINVHGATRAFRIYPAIGPAHVTCHFADSLTDTAVDAILRYVEVSGTLLQKKAAPYPYAIDVDDITIFPPEEELPTLAQLRGIAPGATGGLTSEEFVWSIRGQLE